MKDYKLIHIDHKKLEKARTERHLRATDVARLIGVARQSIWNYENNVCQPPGDVLARLLILYGANLQDVLAPAKFFLSAV